MSIYLPYTYLIGWSKYSKYYYGVRWGKNCNPSELWITYFTSSKYVHDFTEKYGNPDIIEVRKIFKTADKARLWEHKVLKRIKAADKEEWLNITNSISIRYVTHPLKGKSHNEKTRIKISESLLGKKDSEDTRKKKSNASKLKTGDKNGMFGKTGENNPNFGSKRSEETKQKISKANKGKLIGRRRPEHSEKISGSNHPLYGVTVSDETKEKIRLKLKNKPYICCPHCDVKSNSIGAMKRHHFDNCKQK
jgi:hypothetical protein